MARDIFAEDFEDKTEGAFERIGGVGKKAKAAAIENAGFTIAIIIVLVVIAVTMMDIKFVSITEIKDFSMEAFVLLFMGNAMYGNMYHSGGVAAKKLDKYKQVMLRYSALKDEIKEDGFMKRLRAFCKDFVDNELKSCKVEVLEKADVTWAEYQRYKNLSKKELRRRKLSDVKIKAILAANWIAPIKLDANMLYREGGTGGFRYSAMGRDPKKQARADKSLNFAKSLFTMGGMCFIGAELFADPSWATACVVVTKVFAVIWSGYRGYIHGYNNIAVTTVNYTEDQIDLLEQYKVWRGSDERLSTATTVSLVPAGDQ